MLFFAVPVVILIGWCLFLLLHEFSQRMTCSCCKNGCKRIPGLHLFSLLLTFPTCFAARSYSVCFLCLPVFCVYWLSLFFRPMSGSAHSIYLTKCEIIYFTKQMKDLIPHEMVLLSNTQHYTKGSRRQSSAPLKFTLLLCCHMAWDCSAAATSLTE